MHAASRHGTPSLTSLPKDGGVSSCSFIRKVAHPVSDRTQPCLTSVKLMELAGPLGHSQFLRIVVNPLSPQRRSHPLLMPPMQSFGFQTLLLPLVYLVHSMEHILLSQSLKNVCAKWMVVQQQKATLTRFYI